MLPISIECCRFTFYACRWFVEAQDAMLRSSEVDEVLPTHTGVAEVRDTICINIHPGYSHEGVRRIIGVPCECFWSSMCWKDSVKLNVKGLLGRQALRAV